MPAKEHHEFKFAGVWLPAHVVEMVAAGKVSSTGIILYTMVQALQGSDGCYASNAYLARAVGCAVRNVQDQMSKLREAGLIKSQTRGGQRYLSTTGDPPGWVVAKRVAHLGAQSDYMGGAQSDYTHKGSTLTDKAKSPPKNGGDSEGFGLVEATGIPPSEFDNGITTELLDACRRHLGPSHKYVRRAKVSKWADWIRKLRTTDKVEESRIRRVVDWYRNAIGGEYVPQAFSGEAFRAKFEKLEAACKRDILSTTVVTQEALEIVKRLEMLGWPKGSGEAVPAATQASLDAYEVWVGLRNGFNKALGNGTADKYKDSARLKSLGKHLAAIMPAPSQFVEGWMRAVNARINGWDGFHGELAPYIFKPEQKKFRSMGRGWAEAYCSDPDRWDRYTEVLQNEG